MPPGNTLTDTIANLLRDVEAKSLDSMPVELSTKVAKFISEARVPCREKSTSRKETLDTMSRSESGHASRAVVSREPESASTRVPSIGQALARKVMERSFPYEQAPDDRVYEAAARGANEEVHRQSTSHAYPIVSEVARANRPVHERVEPCDTRPDAAMDSSFGYAQSPDSRSLRCTSGPSGRGSSAGRDRVGFSFRREQDTQPWPTTVVGGLSQSTIRTQRAPSRLEQAGGLHCFVASGVPEGEACPRRRAEAACTSTATPSVTAANVDAHGDVYEHLRMPSVTSTATDRTTRPGFRNRYDQGGAVCSPLLGYTGAALPAGSRASSTSMASTARDRDTSSSVPAARTPENRLPAQGSRVPAGASDALLQDGRPKVCDLSRGQRDAFSSNEPTLRVNDPAEPVDLPRSDISWEANLPRRDTESVGTEDRSPDRVPCLKPQTPSTARRLPTRGAGNSGGVDLVSTNSKLHLMSSPPEAQAKEPLAVESARCRNESSSSETERQPQVTRDETVCSRGLNGRGRNERRPLRRSRWTDVAVRDRASEEKTRVLRRKRAVSVAWKQGRRSSCELASDTDEGARTGDLEAWYKRRLLQEKERWREQHEHTVAELDAAIRDRVCLQKQLAAAAAAEPAACKTCTARRQQHDAERRRWEEAVDAASGRATALEVALAAERRRVKTLLADVEAQRSVLAATRDSKANEHVAGCASLKAELDIARAAVSSLKDSLNGETRQRRTAEEQLREVQEEAERLRGDVRRAKEAGDELARQQQQDVQRLKEAARGAALKARFEIGERQRRQGECDQLRVRVALLEAADDTKQHPQCARCAGPGLRDRFEIPRPNGRGLSSGFDDDSSCARGTASLPRITVETPSSTASVEVP
ncbi:hypothetical protein DIPPA_14131 [Diplonema papillatum]|nr:hypothetical protein DIPPA_14131 [Diplonema papillatum]